MFRNIVAGMKGLTQVQINFMALLAKDRYGQYKLGYSLRLSTLVEMYFYFLWHGQLMVRYILFIRWHWRGLVNTNSDIICTLAGKGMGLVYTW